MKNIILSLFLIHIVVIGFSQDELSYEVNVNFPALSISKNQLKEANSLIDLNKHYKPSWVREYISVQISTSYQGKIQNAVSTDDMLSQEQKDLMDEADEGSEIMVNVQYIPENNLKNNEPKEIDFAFIINPEIEAQFVGGHQQLDQYLKDKVIDKIPKNTFTGYDLGVIKFAIDEEGQVIDAHIFWSSNHEEIDQLLLSTIANMPCWIPASYTNGKKVKQEFAFTVGNHKNCTIHTLNIHKE